jgi:uncharacterized protein DUF4058
MPLLDHFHPPLSIQRHWEGFHSAWAGEIARRLNQDLPPRYFAEPNVRIGGQVEIDVATPHKADPLPFPGGGIATAVWAPPHPQVTLPIDLTDLDVFEIRVVIEEGGPTLVAAVELVSPANKDRPAHQQAFAVKCAAYLQQGVSLIVIDVVTSRDANLHLELMRLLAPGYETARDPDPGLHAVAYRLLPSSESSMLEA